MISKKEKYKGQFSIIDTEEKAYFLGFAFGDGCNTYSKGYKFTMASIKKDKQIFLNFGKLFPFFKVCTYPAHPKLVYLENYEKNLVKDLKNLGLLQNKKRSDLKNKFCIPQLDDNLVHHFIRGFFDADGCVYTPSRYRSRNNVKVEIGLGTENFCLELKQLFEVNNLNFTYTVRNKKASNNKYYKSYTLHTSSRKDSLNFAEYIYKDATIFLKRKNSKFFNYIKSPLQIKRDYYPKCPKCDNDGISQGKRKNKQRFRCKSCKLYYSVDLPLIQETV